MLKNKLFRTSFICALFVNLIISCSSIPDNKKEVISTIAEEDRAIANSKFDKGNEYIIGSGDTLDIFVYGHPDLSQKIKVPFSGKITYPFIGDLQAGGSTIFQLRDRISHELAKGYIKNPQVAVNILNIKGRKIYILGKVKTPQVLSVKEEEMSAIEAISRAGGFSRNANQSGVLLIRELKNNKRRMDVLNLESFLKGSDLRQNVKLHRGDILYVPPSFIANVDRFFTHLSNILRPITFNIMDGIILGPRVINALQGSSGEGRQIQ